MLKKIICIALTLILALSMLVSGTSASAYFEDGGTRIDLYEENGWNVFYYTCVEGPAFYTIRIGNCIFTHGAHQAPYTFGVYVQKQDYPFTMQSYFDGYILHYDEAYEKGIVSDLDALVDATITNPIISTFVSISGDANNDMKLTIADVLEIQKAIVDIKQLIQFPKGNPWEYIDFFLHDFNLDNEITTLDVLSMQKHLAGYQS